MVVGNAIDHEDAAVEVLLMHSVSDGDAGDSHWKVEPHAAQCVLLALGGLPESAGADNMVVLVDETAAAAVTEHGQERLLLVP